MPPKKNITKNAGEIQKIITGLEEGGTLWTRLSDYQKDLINTVKVQSGYKNQWLPKITTPSVREYLYLAFAALAAKKTHPDFWQKHENFVKEYMKNYVAQIDQVAEIAMDKRELDAFKDIQDSLVDKYDDAFVPLSPAVFGLQAVFRNESQAPSSNKELKKRIWDNFDNNDDRAIMLLLFGQQRQYATWDQIKERAEMKDFAIEVCRRFITAPPPLGQVEDIGDYRIGGLLSKPLPEGFDIIFQPKSWQRRLSKAEAQRAGSSQGTATTFLASGNRVEPWLYKLDIGPDPGIEFIDVMDVGVIPGTKRTGALISPGTLTEKDAEIARLNEIIEIQREKITALERKVFELENPEDILREFTESFEETGTPRKRQRTFEQQSSFTTEDLARLLSYDVSPSELASLSQEGVTPIPSPGPFEGDIFPPEDTEMFGSAKLQQSFLRRFRALSPGSQKILVKFFS
jgi:hypothetical protein